MPIPAALRLAFDEQFAVFNGSPTGGSTTPLVAGSGHGWQTKLPFDGMAGRTLYPVGDLSYYGDSSTGTNNFSVVSGVLQMSATLATQSGAGSNPYSNAGGGTNPDTGAPLSLPYNSCAMSSLYSFNILYGYMEIHAQIPSGQGPWPGFWMKPASEANDIGGPELDILENFQAAFTKNSYQTSTHRDGNSYTDLTSVANAVGEIDNAFHVYGCDWKPHQIEFYFDGALVSVQPTPRDFCVPMCLLANLQIGGTAGNGSPNGSTPFPSIFQIDYIQVWGTQYTQQVDGNLALFKMQAALVPAAAQPNLIYKPIFLEEFSTLDVAQRGIQGARFTTDKLYSAPNDRTIVNNHEVEYYGDPSSPYGNPYSLDLTKGQTVLQISTVAPQTPFLAPYTPPNTPTLQVVSGEITTIGSFAFLYGNISARLKMNKAAGLWPAFWLLPANNHSYYEFDILEIFGTNSQPPGSTGNIFPYYSITAHSRAGTGPIGDTSTNQRPNTLTMLLADGITAAGLNPNDGNFHVYTMEWTPKGMAFLMDGVLVEYYASITIATTPAYLLLNLAVGGPGSIIDQPNGWAGVPGYLDVDYVRVFATKYTRVATGGSALKTGVIVPAF